MTSQLLLNTVNGPTMRLIGGQYGSRDWQLVDVRDENVALGELSQQYNGLTGVISGTHRFAVRLAPELTGGPRLLALMSIACLDYLRDTRKHRSSFG